MKERIQDWPSEKAARQLLEIYEECSKFNPDERISDFDQIIDKLGESLQALRELDEKRLIKLDEFLSELAFAVVGFDAQKTSGGRTSFCSTSGRTDITIQPKDIHGNGQAEWILLEVRLSPAERLVLEGVSHDRARIILNSRIDAAIRGYKQVRRRSGQQGTYEVYLDFAHVPLNVEGITSCRPVLSRVIGAIESA